MLKSKSKLYIEAIAMFSHSHKTSFRSSLGKIFLYSLGILAIFGAASTSANAATFFDEAYGSANPEIKPFPNSVQNGDFLIRHNKSNDPTFRPGIYSRDIGNGANEATLWTFDFTDDPELADLSPSQTITSATLTLDLLPKSRGINTDAIKISGLEYYRAEEIQTLEPNQQARIRFDLLDFYTSEEIMGVLAGQTSSPDAIASVGMLPMHYSEDALLTYASLLLVTEDNPNNTAIPEPTMVLGILASSSLVVSTRKNKT
ncbi:MAG: hypothetical protein AB4290_31665 [Spirulina sp.]